MWDFVCDYCVNIDWKNMFLLMVYLFSFFSVICCGFLAFRNNWVYRQCMSVLHDENFTMSQNLDRFYRLPSYNTMVFQIFTWRYDVE